MGVDRVMPGCTTLNVVLEAMESYVATRYRGTSNG